MFSVQYTTNICRVTLIPPFGGDHRLFVAGRGARKMTNSGVGRCSNASYSSFRRKPTETVSEAPFRSTGRDSLSFKRPREARSFVMWQKRGAFLLQAGNRRFPAMTRDGSAVSRTTRFAPSWFKGASLSCHHERREAPFERLRSLARTPRPDRAGGRLRRPRNPWSFERAPLSRDERKTPPASFEPRRSRHAVGPFQSHPEPVLLVFVA